MVNVSDSRDHGIIPIPINPKAVSIYDQFYITIFPRCHLDLTTSLVNKG